ncbi:ATP-binding protein [Streptomyces avicenniae]|uniref:ATP-binding protein n=1 Tax=Streptomyces avicenniae TaxID=500153 RepID=UPI00167EEEA6|nr:ATP-binding protein [Streptomyces avicenniae]
MSVPYGVQSVPVLRRQVQVTLRGWEMAATTIGDAAVVVSELAANAVRHALPVPGGLIVAQVSCGAGDAMLRVLVVDGAPTALPPSCPGLSTSADAECGRGLALITGLCLAWGVDVGETTKSVWALLPAMLRAEAG